MPRVLWWGRFDPEYSRNRILHDLLLSLGWQIMVFRPLFSALGDIEAHLKRLPRPDLVWVPCFRQRDVRAAKYWSLRHTVPLLFDPLISAYDKQVDERGKFRADSDAAKRLLAWERSIFASADIVLADTEEHANYFHHQLSVARERIHVVPVGAEERLFRPCELKLSPSSGFLQVLFYGSYIPLQGPLVIAQAARLTAQAPVLWRFVGSGPLKHECERLTQGLAKVRFEDWIPYEALPQRICEADLILGIFGDTHKAARVIPNKVYQALACGRAVLTRASPAYPPLVRAMEDSGIYWVNPGDPTALARVVMQLAQARDGLARSHGLARATYERCFSQAIVRDALAAALATLYTDMTPTTHVISEQSS